MPPMPESRRLARAVRRHVGGHIAAVSQKLTKARVAQTGPLIVELLTHGIEINDDHILLGSWARAFDARYGFSVGDTVLLTQLDDGDWFVHDVITQDDLVLGDHPDLLTTATYNTGSGHVVAEIPYQDQDGTPLGVLLLFDPTTLRDFQGQTTGTGTGAGVVPS